jgi:pilus assembly protein CpaB
MGMRIVLVAVVLVALGGLGLLGAVAFRPPPPPPVAEAAPPPPPPARTIVLVAARSVPAGSLLKPEDLASRDLAAEERAEDALIDSEAARTELRGGLVRRPLSPGDLLRAEDVLRPRDRGFLAAVLARGMRAMSVGVDAVTGAAGLIWPGDRVDLILTQTFEEQEVPVSRRVVGETVLADVRVIAVDQALTQGADGQSTTEGRLVRTVTLEVTPEQAEKVAVASRLGRLALSVRAMDMPEVADVPPSDRSTFGADVSPALRRPVAAPSGGGTMRVHLGTRTEEIQVR